MNRLPIDKRIQIIKLLVEGNSLRATARIVDVAFNTVLRYSVRIGKACLKFHSETVIQVRSKRVECDEIWSFVHTKDKNVEEYKYGVGSVWTWVGFDSDTKLVISWFAGERTIEAAKFFMNDLWCRLRTRVQLSTDGLTHYLEAVKDTFGGRVDFGQLVKQYTKDGLNKQGKPDKRERYAGAIRKQIEGNIPLSEICTSYIERQNLTMRTNIRRFTRETNAFSKKMDNHCYAIALHYVYYNFVRVHSSIRVTPAMESGLTKRLMSFEDLARLEDLYI